MKHIILIFGIACTILLCGCKKTRRLTEIHGHVNITNSIENKAVYIFLVNAQKDKAAAKFFINEFTNKPFLENKNGYSPLKKIGVNELGNYLYEFRALGGETEDLLCFAWGKGYLPSELRSIKAGENNEINFDLKPLNKFIVRFIQSSYNYGTTQYASYVDIKLSSDPGTIHLAKMAEENMESIYFYNRPEFDRTDTVELSVYDYYNQVIVHERLLWKANETLIYEKTY